MADIKDGTELLQQVHTQVHATTLPKSPLNNPSVANIPVDSQNSSSSYPRLSPVEQSASAHAGSSSTLLARALSSCKSPMCDRFKPMDEGVLSFTPQRTKQAPRAWERKASTPFIPRDDKQKIWKRERAPLGELNLESNKTLISSEREITGRKDYTRVVKKLKIDHNSCKDDEESDDKENMRVPPGLSASMWADLNKSFHPKRHLDYIAMHVEDQVQGSPRKKLRRACNGDDRHEDLDGTVHVEEQSKREESSEEPEVGPILDNDQSQELATEGDALKRDIDDSVQHPPSASSVHSLLGFGLKQIALSDTIEVRDQSVGAPTSNQCNFEEERSSSPPTVLGENVLVDELARKANEPTIEEFANTVDAAQIKPHQEPSSESSTLVPRRVSDDEASFLRGFMSRSNASKAARKDLAQDAEQEAHVASEPEQKPPISEKEDGSCQPAPPAEQDESNLRRSKRAVVANPSRSNPAPNTIQLKRAQGNEFIFSANKKGSAADLAITTRNHTKLNRGKSLHVAERLEQLKLEQARRDAGLIKDPKPRKPKPKYMDELEKLDRRVRWNDHALTSYQQARDHYNDDPPYDEEELRINNAVAMGELPLSALKLIVKPPRSEDETTNFASTSAHRQRKQRNLQIKRGGIVGGGNGTPAPKTRSRQSIGQEEVSELPQPRKAESSIASSGTVVATNSSTKDAIEASVHLSATQIEPSTTVETDQEKRTSGKAAANRASAKSNGSTASKPRNASGDGKPFVTRAAGRSLSLAPLKAERLRKNSPIKNGTASNRAPTVRKLRTRTERDRLVTR